MPTYHYFCELCGTSVDVSRKVSELEVLPVCGLCGSVMKRIYAIGGVEFKGNGWGKD
jgi:putative FmdB family regulatory protein